MKGSTTSSGKHRQGGGGLFRDSTHSSQAADVDKWGHDLYENILHEEKMEKQSISSKKSQDYNQ